MQLRCNYDDLAAIEERLADIKAKADAGDYEVAHSLEDELFIAVLQVMKPGVMGSYCADIAEAALRSLDISFIRVTA